MNLEQGGQLVIYNHNPAEGVVFSGGFLISIITLRYFLKLDGDLFRDEETLALFQNMMGHFILMTYVLGTVFLALFALHITLNKKVSLTIDEEGISPVFLGGFLAQNKILWADIEEIILPNIPFTWQYFVKIKLYDSKKDKYADHIKNNNYIPFFLKYKMHDKIVIPGRRLSVSSRKLRNYLQRYPVKLTVG